MQIDKNLIQGKIDIIEKNMDFLREYKDMNAQEFLNNYKDLLEMNFSVKFQYGSIERVPDYKELFQILKELEVICKNITEKVQKELAK